MKKTRLVPFSVQKAKDGAKVVTRCGDPVRIIAYDRKCKSSPSYPIVAFVEDLYGFEMIKAYTECGYYIDEDEESEYDLLIEEVTE